MSSTVDEMIAKLEAEREAIWLTIPDEVAALGNAFPRKDRAIV
jgi:hypothetical protein